MLPLVTCIDEIRTAKELLEVCKVDLDARGIAYNKDIEVGTMIETPAASLIARRPSPLSATSSPSARTTSSAIRCAPTAAMIA